MDDLAEWDGELLMYTYGAAIRRAVRLNPSLGGTVDRTLVTKMEYVEPKRRHCGDCWFSVARIRVTVEGLVNDC